MNWRTVAKRDRDLRDAEGNASEALAKWRYDHTLGAKPKVRFAEYARECGVAETSVRQYAKAHEIRVSHADLTIGEALVRANSSEEQAEVVEVVAKSRGISPESARGYHRDEVRAVRAIARERSERTGRSVRAEAEDFVANARTVADAHAQTKQERVASHGYRYIEVERHLLTAQRALKAAIAVEGVLSDDEREILRADVETMSKFLQLLDERLVDTVADWDEAMRRLEVVS